MNIRTLLLAAFLTFGAVQVQAQVKIGYTNIELILAYMPETKNLENELQIFRKKKAEELKAAEDYANQKLEEYKSLLAANRLSPEEKQKREAELVQLDQELQKKAEEAEFDLQTRRMELLQPIMDKLQKAIDDVAKEKGYTYILNQTTSAGVSTILFGPEEDDITEPVMVKLGIEIPKE